MSTRACVRVIVADPVHTPPAEPSRLTETTTPMSTMIPAELGKVVTTAVSVTPERLASKAVKKAAGA